LGVAIESCHWFYPDSNLRSFGTLEEWLLTSGLFGPLHYHFR
jgi:hypothetical protein